MPCGAEDGSAVPGRAVVDLRGGKFVHALLVDALAQCRALQ